MLVWVLDLSLDCLQSAFSLKIRPVLISSSAIANHDVIMQGLRRDALVSRDKRPRRSRAQVSRAVALQRKIRDCSQSNLSSEHVPSAPQTMHRSPIQVSSLPPPSPSADNKPFPVQNNNNKLYLHDCNNVIQYCKSYLNLILNYLIN